MPFTGEPYDSAVQTAAVTNAIWEENYNVSVEIYMKLRGKTEGLFRINDRAFTGESFRRKIVHAPYSGARTSAQGTVIPAPKGFDRETFTIGRTDLNRVTASIRMSEEDMRAAVGDENATIDLVEDSVRQVRDAAPNRIAIGMHGNAAGLLGLINGTPTDEDDTAYTSGNTNVRFAIDAGSIAYFLCEDLEIDIKDPSGDVRLTMKVEDVFVESKEVILSRVSGVDADCDNVADNDELYFSGEAGNSTGMNGFKEWFIDGGTPSTVYSKDRSAVGGRKYIPNEVSGGGDALVVGDLDSALAPLGYYNRNDNAGDKLVQTRELILTADLDMTQRIMDLMDSAKRLTVPATKDNSRLVAESGFDGYIHHNPIAGPLHFTGDQFHMPEHVRIIDPAAWEWVMLGRPGFLVPPGMPAGQIWKQMVDASGNEYAVYQATWFQILNLVCWAAKKNSQVYSVTSS